MRKIIALLIIALLPAVSINAWNLKEKVQKAATEKAAKKLDKASQKGAGKKGKSLLGSGDTGSDTGDSNPFSGDASFTNDGSSEASDSEAENGNTGTGIYPIDDTQFEWSQGKTKDYSILQTPLGLMIDNKRENLVAFSSVELPMNPETDDFVFGVEVRANYDGKSACALLFDVQDNRNFKGFFIDKSQYQYIVYKDGTPSVVKSGLIKIDKRIPNWIIMKREGSNAILYIGTIDYATIKNVQITNPIFGFGVNGKNKAFLKSMLLQVVDNESGAEQSTTPN